MKSRRGWVYAAVVFFLAAVFVVFSPRSYNNSSTSMMPTLDIDEQFLVFPGFALFGLEINRWDVVVFKYPVSPDIAFVKRVVGLPGDKIEWRNGALLINDKPVDRKMQEMVPPEIPKAKFEDAPEPEPVKVFEESFEGSRVLVLDKDPNYDSYETSHVPADHYYVVGDHRNQSHDSRRWGHLPRANIIGKVHRYPWSTGLN